MTDIKVSDIDQPKAKINVMDSQTVRRLCVERGLYSTPELNEKLYLHFQGFRKIENLEQYTDVCSLFLDNNSLSKIENLDHMTKLKQLYIQNNLLKQLDNLEKLSGLLTLNIGSNQVASLEGIASLAALTTLVANDNQIQDLTPLRSCTSLTSIDLTKNQVSDERVMFSVLEGLPALKCLYLKENPVVSKLPHYRRVIINRLPGLTFLDDRPISAEERRCTSAWEKNGREAEAVERQRIQQEKVDKMNANMIAWRKMKENARSYRGLPPSNPATSDDHNDSDNETQDQTPSRAKIELIEDDEEDAEAAKARTAAEELAAVRDLSCRDVAAVVYRSQTGENLPVLAEKNEFDATFNDVNFIAQEKRRVWKEEQDWLPPAPSHEEKPHTTEDSKAEAEPASQPSSDSDEDVFIGEQPPSKRFSSVPASQTHSEPHQTVSGTLVPAPITSGPRVVAVPITNDEEESSSDHSEEAPQTLEQLSDDAIFGSGLLCPHIVPPSCQWDDDKDDEDEPEEPVQLPERPSDPQESQSDSEEDSAPVKLPMFEVLGNLVSIQSLQRSSSAELKTVGMQLPSTHAGGSEETEEEDAENDEAIIDAREVLKRLDLFRDPEDKETNKELTEKQTEKEEPSVSAVSQADESIEKNAEQTIDLW